VLPPSGERPPVSLLSGLRPAYLVRGENSRRMWAPFPEGTPVLPSAGEKGLGPAAYHAILV
jgi:hypothetical protein